MNDEDERSGQLPRKPAVAGPRKIKRPGAKKRPKNTIAQTEEAKQAKALYAAVDEARRTTPDPRKINDDDVIIR